MPRYRALLVAGVVAVLSTAAAPAAVLADRIRVEVGEIRAALARAQPDDTLILAPGRHKGGWTVVRAVTVEGAEGAVVDGGGRGRVITVDAPGAVVRGLEVTGSGQSLADEDTGIFVTERSRGALVEGNTLRGNLIGVYLKGANRAVVRGNTIVGRRDLRMNERGNGVHVWDATGAQVVDNDIRYGRDGIFVTTSRDNRFHGNRFRDLRFGVHYMYTLDSEVSGNTSRGNHVGYALMYSRGLEVRDNASLGDRDRGLLMNYVNNSHIEGNAVVDGPEKCVFIYNANINQIVGNWFEGCDIGIHFTAGSERNDVAGNAFVDNRTQVKYVGTRHLDWSSGGTGNYWSDAATFDLDGDGYGDEPYRPNDVMDHVVWAYPQAKLLLNSPAVQTLRYVQSQLPSLTPGGVVDTAPMMRPPDVPAATRAREEGS